MAGWSERDVALAWVETKSFWGPKLSAKFKRKWCLPEKRPSSKIIKNKNSFFLNILLPKKY